MDNNPDENKHIVLFIFLAIGLLILSAISKELSTYSFILCVAVILFTIYIKFFGMKPSFIYKDYDLDLGNKIFNESYKIFNGEIKEIWLNGEDRFKSKKIGDCCGYNSFSLDTFPEKFNIIKDKNNNDVQVEFLDKSKLKIKKIFIFFYLVYSSYGLIKFLQKLIPKIPLINVISRNIPFISDITNPSYKGIIAPADIVYFKNDVVELRGLSLMPLSLKETFDTFSVVEYSGKFEELRNIERFIFDKELVKYNYTEMLNTAINAVNAGAKLNPQVKIAQEQSLFKGK